MISVSIVLEHIIFEPLCRFSAIIIVGLSTHMYIHDVIRHVRLRKETSCRNKCEFDYDSRIHIYFYFSVDQAELSEQLSFCDGIGECNIIQKSIIVLIKKFGSEAMKLFSIYPLLN